MIFFKLFSHDSKAENKQVYLILFVVFLSGWVPTRHGLDVVHWPGFVHYCLTLKCNENPCNTFLTCTQTTTNIPRSATMTTNKHNNNTVNTPITIFLINWWYLYTEAPTNACHYIQHKMEQECQPLLKAKYCPRAMPVQHFLNPGQLVQAHKHKKPM